MTEAEATAAVERLDGLATAYVESEEGRDLLAIVSACNADRIVTDVIALAFRRGYQKGHGDGFRFAIDGLKKVTAT